MENAAAPLAHFHYAFARAGVPCVQVRAAGGGGGGGGELDWVGV